MSTKTDLLKQHATLIKNEVGDGMNTANRVGGAILEAAQILESQDTAISEEETRAKKVEKTLSDEAEKQETRINETRSNVKPLVYTSSHAEWGNDYVIPRIIYFKNIAQGVIYRIDADSKVTFDTDHRFYVKHSDNTLELLTGTDGSAILPTDLVLLSYAPTTGFNGGALYISYINATTQKAKKKNEILVPLVGYEAVSSSSGDFVDTGNANPLQKIYRTTSRYITAQDEVSIRLTIGKSNITVRVFEYNENFNMVRYGDFEPISTAWLTKELSSETKYIKCILKKPDLDAIDEINIELLGNDLKEVFNKRPSDNGYQRICVRVNLTNPNACDASTNAVQDAENYGVDYGVICLPPTYKAEGEPTRLIIYCHGAAVNYAADVTRFNTQDLEPEYWLANGYAVMDIEGNPYNNEDEHFGIPQAMECYLAAYKWVINHYNIKRDGVFLGGRSMGGLMTFLLCKDSCPIPVIAACPNVPAAGLIWSWEYMSAQRRAFCAQHMGFVGTAPAWTSNSPMSLEEWNYLKANGLIALKNSIMSMVVDCPSVDEIFANDNNISKSSTSNSPLLTKLESCHMRVKCPVKQFYVMDDATVTPNQCCISIDKMLKNAGMAAEFRLFSDGGGHHYDTQNSHLRTNITTIYGEQLNNIPVVYVEMLQFWRRYEQLN